MAFPSLTLGDFENISDNIAKNQTGPLTFKSMVSGHTVEFKAFIESLTTSFKSNWNTENVYGRMDPVATFQGTQRTIQLSWTVPAATVGEARHNLNAVASLSTMLYPGYTANQIKVTDGNDTSTLTTANSISRSPLIKIKFANLIRAKDGEGLLGYCDGFDHQIEIPMGFFIDNQKMYPKVIKISCNFTVLHQHDLGFDNNNDWIGGGNSPLDWMYDNDLKLESTTPEQDAEGEQNTTEQPTEEEGSIIV